MNLGGNNLHNNAVENGSIGRGNHGYLLFLAWSLLLKQLQFIFLEENEYELPHE